MLLFRLSGVLSFRFAVRKLIGLLFQDPPRRTVAHPHIAALWGRRCHGHADATLPAADEPPQLVYQPGGVFVQDPHSDGAPRGAPPLQGSPQGSPMAEGPLDDPLEVPVPAILVDGDTSVLRDLSQVLVEVRQLAEDEVPVNHEQVSGTGAGAPRPGSPGTCEAPATRSGSGYRMTKRRRAWARRSAASASAGVSAREKMKPR